MGRGDLEVLSRGCYATSVQDVLRGVYKIYSTGRAFAAVLKDETVVTWVLSCRDGDSRSVQVALRGVDKIHFT